MTKVVQPGSKPRKTGPPRTGNVEPFKRADGTVYYRARIRLADESRERVDVPDKFSYSRDRATQWAAHAQEDEDETGTLLARKRERGITGLSKVRGRAE